MNVPLFFSISAIFFLSFQNEGKKFASQTILGTLLDLWSDLREVRMMIKMMIIKVVMEDDDANTKSTFLTPEHIIYAYLSPCRSSLTT